MANGIPEAVYDEDAPPFEYESDQPAEFLPFRRRGQRPAPTPRQSYTPPPPSDRPITHSQLQSALDAVRQDMARNAQAVAAVSADVARVRVESQRDLTRLREDQRRGSEMSALLPLLASQSVQVQEAGDPADQILPTGTRVQVAADSMMALLPLLLSGSVGGSSSPGASQPAGGMDMSMLLLLMMMMRDRPSNR